MKEPTLLDTQLIRLHAGLTGCQSVLTAQLELLGKILPTITGLTPEQVSEISNPTASQRTMVATPVSEISTSQDEVAAAIEGLERFKITASHPETSNPPALAAVVTAVSESEKDANAIWQVFFAKHGLLSNVLCSTVMRGATGSIKVGVSMGSYEEDALHADPAVVAFWRSGFYRNSRTGEQQLLLTDIENGVIFIKDGLPGTDGFTVVYVKQPDEAGFYRYLLNSPEKIAQFKPAVLKQIRKSYLNVFKLLTQINRYQLTQQIKK